MCCSANGKLLNAFDAIAAVRNGPEWHDGHIAMPQQKIFGDITHGQLQSVSWVIPDQNDSDHPGTSSDTGPSWVASVVNAIGESSYWNSTAIVIVWDDWGGLYDNLNPPQLGYGGLGFRVPAIIVSPYAKPGYISKTQYEFGSILKYIETELAAQAARPYRQARDQHRRLLRLLAASHRVQADSLEISRRILLARETVVCTGRYGSVARPRSR